MGGTVSWNRNGGTGWWNSGTDSGTVWWNSVGGTVWWNSGTVIVEQCKCNSVVKQCDSEGGTVEQ